MNNILSKFSILYLKVKSSIVRTIRNWYNFRRAEIFIISFPKCGRTWLRLMIGRVFEQYFSLENVNIFMLSSLSALHPKIPRIELMHDDLPMLKKAEELNVSKKKYRNKKVIFLVRDPRDVVVSNYFQKSRRKHISKDKFFYGKDLSDFIYEEVGSIDTIIKYFNIWAENRDIPKQFLLVTYEDIHQQTEKELRRVLDFIGFKDIDDKMLKEAVEYCSFENMKKMEADDKFKTVQMRPTDKSDEESYKTRKGKVKGFNDYLGHDQIEYLNRKIEKELSDYYSFYP